MCGILAGTGILPFDSDLCRRQLACLQHRGPDAGGIQFLDSNRTFLGHRRLKIIDPDPRSNQPMASPCGRYLLIFNGEIYNYRSLRESLKEDWEFRTSGDTETLLAACILRREAVLEDLRGMFAFLFLDTSTGQGFAARDQFGIKPLYYHQTRNHLLFCSEIPPLLVWQSQPAPDEQMIATYLQTGHYDFGDRTFFQGIRRLDAGCCLRFRTGETEFTIRRYYQVGERLRDLDGLAAEPLLDELDHLLKQAVERHLIADTAIGLNISGGLDSSTLVHYVNQASDEPLHGFNQDYEGYSEAPWVHAATQNTRIKPTIIPVSPHQARDALHDVVAAQAEPFGGIAVIGYHFLYRKADAMNVTVLLDGNGIDEVFLGYRKYHDDFVLGQIGTPNESEAIRDYAASWQCTEEDVRTRIRHRLDAAGLSRDGTRAVRSEAIHPDLLRWDLQDYSLAPTGRHPVRQSGLEDLLRTKIPRGLRFNDRASMMWSKELRVPFLDTDLVEFGLALPIEHLIRGGESKALIRQLMGRYLPPEVTRSPKRMIQTPQREWLADEWRDLVLDIIESKSFSGRGWVLPERAASLYRDYCNGARDNSFFIWQWLNLELWARRFLDGNS